MILVTGAAGSVGRALLERLPEAVGTDIVWGVDRYLDVTNRAHVDLCFRQWQPRLVYHLAGAKHAFDGELDPARVASVNIDGTRNILDAAAQVDAKVVFASTCKACDPETAYGASKLIAERLVINAGGTVVRYYNIPESDGNVFRMWETLPAAEPVPYTDCWRYFITMDAAVDLTINAAELPPGRYIADPGMAKHMAAVAADLYPDRELVEVPRRRGDRYMEPLKAGCEEIWPVNGTGLYKVTSPYDGSGLGAGRSLSSLAPKNAMGRC